MVSGPSPNPLSLAGAFLLGLSVELGGEKKPGRGGARREGGGTGLLIRQLLVVGAVVAQGHVDDGADDEHGDGGEDAGQPQTSKGHDGSPFRKGVFILTHEPGVWGEGKSAGRSLPLGN